MGFLIGLFTVVLVLDSIFLIFLILLQLPKKEAGAGMAFGGGATEALFGAGSGTVLTKATKYSAGMFMGLALVLSVLNSYRHSHRGLSFQEEIAKSAAAAGPTLSSTSNAPAVTLLPMTSAPAATPGLLLSSTNVASTNSATTNLPAAPPAQ